MKHEVYGLQGKVDRITHTYTHIHTQTHTDTHTRTHTYTHTHLDRQRDVKEGLPWYLGGKETTSQSRRHRSHPCPAEIPRATEQPSPCATTLHRSSRGRKLQLPSPGAPLLKPARARPRTLPQEESPQGEAPAPQLDSCPHSTQLESRPH